MNITASTISNNTATDTGGGIVAAGSTTIVNSTISGNEALTFRGGGLYALFAATVDIRSSTIANNEANSDAGGMVVDLDATVNFVNTIVGDQLGGASDERNSSPGSPDIILFRLGTANSLGFNIIADPTFVFSNGNQGTDNVGGDPDLSPLADNGGPTFTHLPGGDAVDIGNSNEATDQRGTPRPQRAQDDIVAVERLEANPRSSGSPAGPRSSSSTPTTPTTSPPPWPSRGSSPTSRSSRSTLASATAH